MARRKSPTFTEVELEFMQIVWDQEEVTTEDMQNILRTQDRDLSDGSIRKILSILMDKGHLERHRVGRSFIYHPKENRQQAHRSIIQDMLKRAFDNSASLLVAALLDTRKVTREEIEEIKHLIKEHEE